MDEATQLSSITERLAMDYQGKIKKQNEEAELVFSRFKAEGTVEEDKIISQARSQAAQLMDETKKEIAREMSSAKEELRSQIPQISGLIASRLLGRNL